MFAGCLQQDGWNTETARNTRLGPREVVGKINSRFNRTGFSVAKLIKVDEDR